MISINSPSNPSGAVFDKKSMKLVADLCEDHDLYAMSDEIYEKLIYGKEHISLAVHRQHGRADHYHQRLLQGLRDDRGRLGYAVAPKTIIKAMSKVQQHSVSQVTTFAMWGGVAALKGDQRCVEEMRTGVRQAPEVHDGRAQGTWATPAPRPMALSMRS